jgi:hypothetical protein
MYCLVFYLKCNILETGFYLQLQVKPTQTEVAPYLWAFLIDLALLSRFYLRMETESSLQKIVLNRTMDNVQKHSNSIFVRAEVMSLLFC